MATGRMQTRTQVSEPTQPASSRRSVVITATFTAEPIESALRFWLKKIGLDGRIEFAPYHQAFKQLLDPESVLGRNTEGINVMLGRFGRGAEHAMLAHLGPVALERWRTVYELAQRVYEPAE
jgi:hypothetical protein